MVRNEIQSEMKGVDKGWSWVVAAACFFGSLILAGIFRTSGVLFVAFIHAFGVTREEASWPMVVCIAVLNLTGPFSGILGQRFGTRPIVMIGAAIATTGVASCYFTTSLHVITILFGGVFGIGWGLMNTLMPIILNAYFLNLRATANGIANSGSCIGSIILPLVFEFLIATYGLSGCFLLTGGMVLQLLIAGALMRPPPWLEKQKYIEKKNEINKLLRISTYAEDHTLMKLGPEGKNNSSQNAEATSRLNSPDSANHSQAHTENVEAPPYVTHNKTNVTSSNAKSSILLWDLLHRFLDSKIISSFVKVLCCPMFYVTAVTNVCFYFLYHMYVVIILDYALDREVVETDTKNILFAFSIADMFGRLGLGWITDRKFISRSRYVMLTMALIGLTFFAFPYANGYNSLIVVSCLYGVLLGCTMILFPILLVDFCGLELHAVAYGCMCFMNGFASFARPFLIGYFRDNIGSYSNIFYILGGLSVASSALWLLELCFNKKENAQSLQIA